MAGTTTNYSIPYPSITDFVTDGATDMEAIAEKVDDILFAEVANNNLIINGAMQVTQRSAVGTEVTGITTAGYRTADRFQTVIGSLGIWKQATIADAPTGSGFVNSLKITCTTAYPSPIVGSRYAIITQAIEGQNCQAIRKGTASAQPLTLSFWVKSGVTGTYIVEMYDSTGRAISKSYTITSANTWEYKTISIPADTSGVIPNTNAEGFTLRWWLAAGDSYTSGTLQTSWGASVNANIAVGQTNLAEGDNAAVNYWQMTGAQLTVGDVNVPYQFKSIADDLADCQRYYWRSADSGLFGLLMAGGVEVTNSIASVGCINPVTMRTTPTISIGSGIRFFSFTGGVVTPTISGQRSTATHAAVQVSVSLGTGGQAGYLYNLPAANSHIEYNGEL